MFVDYNRKYHNKFYNSLLKKHKNWHFLPDKEIQIMFLILRRN